MKRRSQILFPAAMSAAVALALLAGFWLSYWRRPAPGDLLLPPPQSLYNPVSGGTSAAPFPDIPEEIITVKPETVQAVLKTISRPGDYTAEYRTTYRYGSMQTPICSNVYARGGIVKIEALGNDDKIDSHYLTDGKILCFWENKGPIITTVSMGKRGTDDPARIPAYESIFYLDKSDILSAAYEEHDGRPYIVLTTVGPVYNTTWWISLDTSLMHKAELAERDGSPAISVEMTDYKLESPPEDFFKLPDGRPFEELLSDTTIP